MDNVEEITFAESLKSLWLAISRAKEDCDIALDIINDMRAKNLESINDIRMRMEELRMNLQKGDYHG